jgi:hypothetical protein
MEDLMEQRHFQKMKQVRNWYGLPNIYKNQIYNKLKSSCIKLIKNM